MTIQDFAALVQEQTRAAYARAYGEEAAAGCHGTGWPTTVKPGRKYTKVDVGSSGRFMVENATGEIFGIKGYGKIHKGHRYGTLETTDRYHWGEYSPVRKGGAS